MTDRTMPRYPIYVPSKGRVNNGLTAKHLAQDGVPFYLVVEDQEHDAYAAAYPDTEILVLPFSDKTVVPVRNWIKDHSTARGDKRHWQIDDNIRHMYRWFKGKRLYCRYGVALAVMEDFTDRYQNIAIAGPNYVMFASVARPPYCMNVHVYSCTLMLNEIPHRFRLAQNEDVDMCLQVLADHWCIVQFNVFLIQKMWTMSMEGGNTDALYSKSDSRLRGSRLLERAWPGVAETDRRFQRPHFVINSNWTKFDQKLIRRTDIDFDSLKGTNNYGMQLTARAPVKSKRLQQLLEDAGDAGT